MRLVTPKRGIQQEALRTALPETIASGENCRIPGTVRAERRTKEHYHQQWSIDQMPQGRQL
jgi:hypothetical protein